MKTLRTPALALATFVCGFLIFLVRTEAELPERVATHFNLDGRPNGWMSRPADLIFSGAFGVGLPLLFIAISLLVRFAPARSFNVPHREYWLAPELREETNTYVFRQLLWLGCLVEVFLTGIQFLIIVANRSRPAHLPTDLFLTVLGGFLVGVGVWSFLFIRHFSRAA